MEVSTLQLAVLLIKLSFLWMMAQCEKMKMPNGNCPQGSFPCNSTGQCLPQRHWCDETVHCDDGSDEASCVDENQDELINKQFRKRPGANIDKLPRECNFTEKHEFNRSVANNNKCRCQQSTLFCNHLQLSRAPSIGMEYELKEGVDLLDLSGNNFKKPSITLFHSLQGIPIKKLVLKHCGIQSLEARCFDELLHNHLEELHLDGNQLTHLHDQLFNVDNNHLRLLSIGHNAITSIDPATFKYLSQLIELDLSNNHIAMLDGRWFQDLYSLITLKLQGNQLKSIDVSSWTLQSVILLPTSTPMPANHVEANDIMKMIEIERRRDDSNSTTKPRGLENLITLSLANNHIESIQNNAFVETAMRRSLINLDLSGNYLSTLLNTTFKGLSTLRLLKINDNNLQKIHNQALYWMHNLTSLDLRKNQLNLTLSPDIFMPLTHLYHLYFDSFEMCANAPFVKVCEPKSDGISSKEHLLDSVILRASVWIMALIGFIGNSIVILGRQFVIRHSNMVDSLHIKNLAISDLLMSSYLFMIASVDEYYRGEYLINEFIWRHSNWCNLSGFLNSLSCESSVLILSLVTWDRYVSVTRPFPRNQVSFKFVAFRLVALWCCAALIAILPILSITRGYFHYEFYNSNGVCLPLYLHNPYAKGWQYSMAMFVFINLSALIFICYAYLRMIKAIRVSTVACRSTQQTQDRDRVAQHLGIIVFTDCLCWVPVIAIKMATLAGLEFNQSYKNFVYASLAIYVMPINSALNPILYTFATPLFKKQLRKMALMCCKGQKKTDGQSGDDTALSLSLGMLRSNGKRVLTYRSTQTSHTGSKSSWRKHPQAV